MKGTASMRHLLNGSILMIGLGVAVLAYRVSAPPSSGGGAVSGRTAPPVPTVLPPPAYQVQGGTITVSNAVVIAPTESPTDPTTDTTSVPVLTATTEPAARSLASAESATLLPAQTPVPLPSAAPTAPVLAPVMGAASRETTHAGPAVYRVKAGDTLISIAQHTNKSVDALAKQNQLTNKNLITVGQILQLP